MKIILHDFQDGSYDPFDGAQVDDPDTLLNILGQLQLRDPFILELEGDNGYRLIVGIGGPVSCIQHGSSDGEPPYTMAVMKDASQSRKTKCRSFFAAVNRLKSGAAGAFRSQPCNPSRAIFLRQVTRARLLIGLRSSRGVTSGLPTNRSQHQISRKTPPCAGT
jgi:hypothetical protein